MRQRQREIFSSMRTEGNLLPVDFLQCISESDRDIDGLSLIWYHLGKSERLKD